MPISDWQTAASTGPTADALRLMQRHVISNRSRFYAELAKAIGQDTSINAGQRVLGIVTLMFIIHEKGDNGLAALYSDIEARAYMKAAAQVMWNEKKAALQAEQSTGDADFA